MREIENEIASSIKVPAIPGADALCAPQSTKRATALRGGRGARAPGTAKLPLLHAREFRTRAYQAARAPRLVQLDGEGFGGEGGVEFSA
jgi:hypothetical protein